MKKQILILLVLFSFSKNYAQDLCTDAVAVNCGDSISGTTVGATTTGAPTAACGIGPGGAGVWYTFSGTGEIIDLSLCGSDYDTKIQVYEGTCTSLICVTGNDDGDCPLFQSKISFVSVAGTTYYIYVFGFGTETGNYVLDVTCLPPPPPPIVTDITTYTVTQLIEDILIDGDCANVSNITSSTHSTGTDTGISYFTNSGPGFPYEEGIIISSGRAADAAGPFINSPNGGFSSAGDTDLENTLGLGVSSTGDATVIEFDFVPIAPQMTFNFLMASSEYQGSYQCDFSDAFAFILTHPDMSVSNLAVLPTSDTGNFGVSITNIHPDIPGDCGPANEEYFGEYTPPFGEIAYNGRTISLTAQSAVIPGETYHIKLVIADHIDSAVDTAVFIEGGSFSLGSIDLGSDVFLGDPEANCEGDLVILDAGIIPTGMNIVWYKDGVVIEGETTQFLEIGITGDYTAEIGIEGTDCASRGTVHIEFYPNPEPNLGEDSIKCANENLVLDANVSNTDNPNMGSLTYTWKYNGTTVQTGAGSTYLISPTVVQGSGGNQNGAVQFPSPVDGSPVYADLVDEKYLLGQFTVTVTDDVTGCSGISTMNVNFYQNANCVDIPTGISPNNDGVNDCIVLDDLEDIVGISKMQIYNRYGTRVFENAQYVREWCGTNDGGKLLPTGTYYYILEYEDGRSPLKNWVYVNREK